jgi:hypothetical protein
MEWGSCLNEELELVSTPALWLFSCIVMIEQGMLLINLWFYLVGIYLGAFGCNSHGLSSLIASTCIVTL